MAFTHRELAAFLSIARTGSVGSAATALALTQPALSRTLRKLEVQLGCSLFDRHAAGMRLTSFGRTLLPHAELLEAEASRAVEEIQLLKGASRGLARVGVVPSVAVDLLPRAIASVLSRSPGMQIQVIEGPGDQLAAMLMRGELDFAIAGLGREPVDGHVLATPLLEDDVCVVGRAGHPLLRCDSVAIGDLAAASWALPEKGNVIWSEFRMMFRRAGVNVPQAAVATNSVLALKSTVLATDLLTMLARTSFAFEERHGLMAPIPFQEGRWRRQLGVLRRATGRLLPAADLMLQEIRRIAHSE